MLLSWWQLVVIVAGLAGIMVIFLRYQHRLMLCFDGRVRRQLDDELDQDTL